MACLNVWWPQAGLVPNTTTTTSATTLPSIVYIQTNDTYATVTTAGYLNKAAQMYGAGTFNNSQMALVYTTDDKIVWLQVSVTFSGATASYSLVTPPTGSASFSSITLGDGSVSAPTLNFSGRTTTGLYSSAAATMDVASAGTRAATFNYAAGSAIFSGTSSATPGTIRALVGKFSGTATTMTSGNLVGVRGEVDYVGASGGFLYGVQGKLIPTGTLSGSSWNAGVFGQLDISAATVNAGQTACIWGDYGTTSGTISDASGMRGIAMTNTTAAVLNAQDYRYGNATYLLELAGAGGTLNYYAAAGTSGGSAGDAAHCAAQQVIKIEINGVAAYIPVFT